jgi:hypothetical protein
MMKPWLVFAVVAFTCALGCKSATKCAEPGVPCGDSECCIAPYSCMMGSCLVAERPPVSGTSCNGAAASDLPGVSILFPDDRCSYTPAEVAAGIAINYQVRVEQSLDGIHPVPVDLGGCGTPDTSGLIVGFEITGNSNSRYCLCDVGPCMRQTFTTQALTGTYPAAIQWDGRNWLGPSDTGNPKGTAFPPGTYTLTVTAKGTWNGPGSCDASLCSRDAGDLLNYQVTATRFLTITP